VAAVPVVDEKKSIVEKADSINALPDLETVNDEKVVIQSDRTFGIDQAYVEKSQLISDAMQSIGMTSWQYQVWALCGFGWIVDNVSSLAFYALDIQYRF
jgi:hypothetical protein